MDTELLANAYNGNDIGILSDALRLHIETGRSLDDILGLKSKGAGQCAARVTFLRQRRGESLLFAHHLITTHAEDITERKACFVLFSLLYRDNSTFNQPTQRLARLQLLQTELDVIRSYDEMLGCKVSKPENLYQSITDLKYKLS